MSSKTALLRPSQTERSRLLALWLAAVALLLVQRPLSSHDLWWHLARGREVFAGSFSPSRQLLVLDAAREADWLGGVPFYFVWSLGGIHALAAVPLLAAFALVALLARALPHARRWPAAVLFLPLLLWAVRDGLQPVPQLFDLFGLVVLARVVQAEWPQRRRLAVIAVAVCLWANLGAQPLWALLLVALFSPTGRSTIPALAAALIGGSLTPRGALTWWDAAILFSPTAFEAPGDVHPAGWPGLLTDFDLGAAPLAFLLLWSAWVARGLFQKPGLITGLRWSVPILAAMLSRANLPGGALWIAIDLLRPVQSQQRQVGREAAPKRRWLAPVALLILVLALFDAAGRGLPPASRLGWGIDQSIDPRLLDPTVLTSGREALTGWAPDARSVGIVAWLRGNVSMLDHPQRALLAGRWPAHLELVHDLQTAHRAGYRRDDGSWGGWVQRLAEWEVGMLFLPMEAGSLNRALVETPWKPADLDSPTVPYVDADDPAFAGLIVEVIRQQGFVEVGPWQPSVGVYGGHGWRFDAVQTLGLGPDPAPGIRQSQFFRALNIPIASLRALLPVRRRSGDPRLAREFRACQRDLAYQEWVAFGQASLFRRLVVGSLNGRAGQTQHPSTSMASDEPRPDSGPWNRCIADYLEGNLPAAIRALSLRTPHERYAAAMLKLEAGQTESARSDLEQIPAAETGTAVSIAADYWREQISLFERE